MPSRKRAIHEVGADVGNDEQSLLQRIRNMWQFANLCQWIYIFGKAAKIDDSVDIEEIETNCLKPNSDLLPAIALALLKLISSHRGLTLDILDDQLRKQFISKTPTRNPFGDDDNPISFAYLDIFTKIKVLQQLTQWVMIYPERIRDKMAEQKDVEQTDWRIEPYGWDRNDCIYYVLDDNRVYRFSEPSAEAVPPKRKKTNPYRTGRRSSKRQHDTVHNERSDVVMNEGNSDSFDSQDTLGGGSWECIAVTLQEVRSFLETLVKTRDENERVLRRQLEEHLVPILEKQEEAMNRRQLQRDRELLNLAKMANAKRSSRIADKAEKQKRDDEEKEEERHRLEAEEAEQRNAQAQLEQERKREIRMFARQRRLKEREARRLRHEEELAQLSEDSKNASDAVRISDRRLEAEIERNKQALRDLDQEEDDWVFDCICGLHGQVDDGAHSVACEKCNVWQHSKCLGINEAEAESPDFHFVCATCQRRQKEARLPKTIIKLKVRPSAGPNVLSQHDPSGATPVGGASNLDDRVPEYHTTNTTISRPGESVANSMPSQASSVQATHVANQLAFETGNQVSERNPERPLQFLDDIRKGDENALKASREDLTYEGARRTSATVAEFGTQSTNEAARKDPLNSSLFRNKPFPFLNPSLQLPDNSQNGSADRESGDISLNYREATSSGSLQNPTFIKPQDDDHQHSNLQGGDEMQPKSDDPIALPVLKQSETLHSKDTASHSHFTLSTEPAATADQ